MSISDKEGNVCKDVDEIAKKSSGSKNSTEKLNHGYSEINSIEKPTKKPVIQIASKEVVQKTSKKRTQKIVENSFKKVSVDFSKKAFDISSKKLQKIQAENLAKINDIEFIDENATAPNKKRQILLKADYEQENSKRRSIDSFDKEIQPLIRIAYKYHKNIDADGIEKAYKVAKEAHKDQYRHSGEPYITHPIHVAEIIANLGLLEESIEAALLHDVVEDADYPLEKIEKEFGADVAGIVNGVTKIDSIKYGNSDEETLRKMIVSMSKDIRVIIVKLADRLHNARTWKYVPIDRAKRKAKQTLEIYAPLANRIGLNDIKLELENLSFKFLHPDQYNEIKRYVAEEEESRKKYIKNSIREIKKKLKENDIKAEVIGRSKHYYSIYRKITNKGISFDQLYDLIGIRIITDSVKDCYAALGVIHTKWTPIPTRFKDYIAVPKMSLYQSLHTVVVDDNSRRIEIQIRTHEMDERAVYGIAAHWKYKETGSSNFRNDAIDELDTRWLKTLKEMQESNTDSTEFLKNLKFSLESKHVYVFTPRGAVKELPVGSTPIDFAFSIHTEVGFSLIGAKVNGKLVPVKTKLHNGDVVEILTSKSQKVGPSPDWLDIVKTSRARTKITHWLLNEHKAELAARGREVLEKYAHKKDLPQKKLLTKNILIEVSEKLKCKNIEDFYERVYNGNFGPEKVFNTIIELLPEEEKAKINSILVEKQKEEDKKNREHIQLIQEKKRNTRLNPQSSVQVSGDDTVFSKLAKCCTPVPGDKIGGFITRGNGVTVHNINCVNFIEAQKNQPERIVDVSWVDVDDTQYMVSIKIEAFDRPNMLNDITKVIYEERMNILSLNAYTTDNGQCFFEITISISTPDQMKSMINKISQINNVFSVKRYNGGQKG